MIKLSFSKIWVSVLLIGASLSVVALATSRPEQVHAIADTLTATPQDEPALAARFTDKGPWS